MDTKKITIKCTQGDAQSPILDYPITYMIG